MYYKNKVHIALVAIAALAFSLTATTAFADGHEFEGDVKSVGDAQLVLEDDTLIYITGDTQWDAEGDVLSLVAISAALTSGLEVEIEGTYVEGSTDTAATIKAETDDEDDSTDDGDDVDDEEDEDTNDSDRPRDRIQDRRDEFQQNREDRQEERQERQEDRQENREQRQGERQERMHDRFEQFTDRVIARLRAAIERMENIVERLRSRITKLEERFDIDLSSASALVDTAETEIGEADTAIDQAERELLALLATDDLRGLLGEVRGILGTAIESLREARRALVAAIQEVRAAVGTRVDTDTDAAPDGDEADDSDDTANE